MGRRDRWSSSGPPSGARHAWPGIAVKQVFDIARRAIVERRARAADELADLIFGLVVQLGGAFSIRAIGFRDQFLPLPGGRREQLPKAPGHFRQVGGRLAREKLGHHGVERLLLVVVGGKPGGQRLRFRGEFVRFEGREGLPWRHHAMVAGPGAFEKRLVQIDNGLVKAVRSLARCVRPGLSAAQLRGHEILFSLTAVVAEDPLPLGLQESLVIA